MSADIQFLDKKILDQAAWSFRRSAEARQALRWFKVDAKEFKRTTEEFDQIIKNMNFILKGDEAIDQENFGAVARLRQALPELKNTPLPSLEGLAEAVNSPEHPEVFEAVMATFEEIGSGLAEGGAWNWAIKEPAPVMATGLLIEGYARMLVRQFHNNTIVRDFVLGFEETGWAFCREKGIMQNVLPWMKDPKEIGDFSPNVQRQLQAEA